MELFDIKKIAKLANLIISKEEENKFSIQFSQILTYFEKLRALNVKEVEPTNQVTGLKNVTRTDNTTPSLTQEEVLSNAKTTYNGLFAVKAIFDSENT